MAQGWSDGGTNPQDHESCTTDLKFKYYSEETELDWGTTMICSPTVNDIFVEAFLEYEQP